jgi:hypothetical protein
MVIACVVAQNCSSILSMTPSVEPSTVPNFMGWTPMELIVDPSDEIIKVLLAALPLRWDMQQHCFGLIAEGSYKPHALSAELLELLKENMPDRIGGPKGWNFDKAHTAT